MDVGTTAAIVGIVAAVVYVVETTCKYGYTLFKKGTLRTSSSGAAYNLKKTHKKRSRPLSTVSGTSYAVPQIVRDIAAARPEVRALLFEVLNSTLSDHQVRNLPIRL